MHRVVRVSVTDTFSVPCRKNCGKTRGPYHSSGNYFFAMLLVRKVVR